MVRFYYYNDLSDFKTSIHNVHSNLCTMYYPDKKKFCGNYCSRKVNKFNRRCWRHPKPYTRRESVVLLMISSSERFYNRDKWIKFLTKCQLEDVPIELVIYHEDMWNSTVRHPHNLISRFRPFPDLFGGNALPLRQSHGGINYAQIHLRMLDYGNKLPNTTRCVILTERTIPIRSPATVYKSFTEATKCRIDVSYNVRFSTEPEGLPVATRGDRGYVAVNNHAQGMFTSEFLRVAIPTVANQYRKFGLSKAPTGVYTITDRTIYQQWRDFTSANADEFWLLNSFLLQLSEERGTHNNVKELEKYVEKVVPSEKYVVAEIPQWRDNGKRTFVFRHRKRKEKIDWFDNAQSYYRDLDITKGVSLRDVIKYLRRHKKKAMFFRQVELP